MKALISLSKLIYNQRIKNIDILNEKTLITGKSQLLLNGILENRVIDRKTAMKVVYGGPVNSKTLNQLISRLENKILNLLFLIDLDQSNFKESSRALHSVCKNLYASKILFDRTERTVAIKLIERAFKISDKFEMTEFSISMCRELQRHYAYLEPNKRKHEFYRGKFEELKPILEAEMLSEQYYCEISKYQAVKRETFNEKTLKMHEAYCFELRQIQKNIKSVAFNMDTFQICIYYYIKTRNFEKAMELGYEALKFFDNKTYDAVLQKYLIRNDLIACSIQLKKFVVAEQYLDQNLALITAGSFNWFKLLNLQFLNFAMQEDYNNIQQIIYKVFTSDRFKRFSIHYESWLIKEAYVHFLIQMGKVDQAQLDKYPLRPFRLNRFLNDVPLYSKDKRGLNISILIIQMLFLILQKKFDQVIDRMDALQQYTYRYLRNDETYRSNCFIKMLLKIPDAGFNPIRTQRHVENLHKKLLATSMDISEQSSEIEVIPYENLWEMVIQLLEKVKSG